MRRKLVAVHVLPRNIPGISKRVLREAVRDCENKTSVTSSHIGVSKRELIVTFKVGRAIHSLDVSHSGGLGSSPVQLMWNL
jgi:hypothetical protein